MAAIRENNKTLFSMVIAQAHTIAIEGASIVFTFAPVHKSLRAQLETKRAVVEQIAQNVTGKKMSLVVREAPAAPTGAPAVDPAAARKAELIARAKAEPTVQAMLDVFGGEIQNVEELE